MTALPVQVLHGIYLGLLAGVVPAVVAFGLGFLFRYVVGLTVPAFGVVVLGVALAGVNGGLLAFADPSITGAANAATLVVALLVVTMLTLYTHAVGDRLGADLPRRITLRGLRDRTLHADVVDLVGGRSEVTVRVVGSVRDVEGYPPLPEPLRAELRAVAWQFPGDLRLSELEERVTDRLRSEFDLQEVSVSVDERGRANLAAAPPAAGVSKRTPTGRRAVSVETLVPTGMARGDEVAVLLDDGRVEGTVVSARSDGGTPPQAASADPESAAEDAHEDDTPVAPSAPTTTGGEGRVTVAVSRSDADRLLDTDRAPVVVEARGTGREYELLGVLRRAGQRVRRLALGENDPLGVAASPGGVREEYGVAVLAVRDGGSWRIAPEDDRALAAGDELFVAGSRADIDRFAEVVA
ncbi:TrkA C-terminal domain-containing protein [Halobacterium jilantaiense]|uniref:TrkA-C domain-containing protein n=1 Tax=Halobacterium jilantaiense TaxID=355548 RepID=A0A1I0QHE2_9EURY|nr:TrkA C-terminal domain-containing protein [Halobacterium jilantaiense]SEW26494.1 TrkA-C domain-containing protein [Halobacterium jilantaiense]